MISVRLVSTHLISQSGLACSRLSAYSYIEMHQSIYARQVAAPDDLHVLDLIRSAFEHLAALSRSKVR